MSALRPLRCLANGERGTAGRQLWLHAQLAFDTLQLLKHLLVAPSLHINRPAMERSTFAEVPVLGRVDDDAVDRH